MVVGDDELDPGKAALLQAREKFFPDALAFTVSQFDDQYLTLTIPVAADIDQYGAMCDNAGFPDRFIAGIEVQVADVHS